MKNVINRIFFDALNLDKRLYNTKTNKNYHFNLGNRK